MIIIPTKAIIIPTHTSIETHEVQATQYFDVVYYQNTGHSIVFHSMTTTIPLEELEQHIEQMDSLKVSIEIHVPNKDDKGEVTKMRKMSHQAHLAVMEQVATSHDGLDPAQRLL